jgi:surface protein
MNSMFNGAQAFNQNIGAWNVSSVTNMNNMFQYASVFNQDLSGWDISVNLVPRPPSQFSTGSALTSANTPFWFPTVIQDSNNVTYKFVGPEPTGIENPFFVTDVNNVNVVYAVMRSSQDADSIAKINAYALNQTTGAGPFTHSTAGVIPFNRIVTTNMTNMANMFDMNSIFNTPENTFNSDISTWDVSNVTNMTNMFQFASAFNQNIGGWNVSSVTNMSYMFLYASAFNQNIGGWNVSKVTTMQSMFQNAGAFNQNIGAWNVSSVNNMSSMFDNAEAFNQNIGAWNVSKVGNMSYMFYLASAFNQNIGAWNVSSVTTMNNMFHNASVFNQDLSDWFISVNLSPKPPAEFSTGSALTPENTPIWFPVIQDSNNVTYKFIGPEPTGTENPFFVTDVNNVVYAVMRSSQNADSISKINAYAES